MLLELGFEPIEQGKRVRGGPGEAGHDFALSDAADFAGLALHDCLAKGDLAVSGHGGLAIAANSDDCSGAEDRLLVGFHLEPEQRKDALLGCQLPLLLLASEGVSPVIDLHQTVNADMGVALGGGEARVAEELLNRPKVRPCVEKVRGARVA